MKNSISVLALICLFGSPAWAQLQNQGGYLNITSGSFIKALDGVVNTADATLTVDGTLSTPADLSNTVGATLKGDGQYHIGGNWTNEANFSAGTSTVTFEGAQNSTVTSGGSAFYLLVLNKSGGNNLLLADDMDVSSNFDFQAADNFAILGNYNLEVGDISGYATDRHVRTNGTGFLVRNVGGSAVDFPVGNTNYNPAVLTNAGTPDFYLVRVADAVLSGGDAGSPITVDAVGRGWFVEEGTPGGSDLSLVLQWNGTEEPATFDRTNAYVSHFLAGSWDSQPTAAAVGADPYTLSRSGITSLSPFAIFDGDFSALIDISGIILWEHDGTSGVKDANVALTGDDTDSDVTDIDGNYTVTAANGSNFTVTPTKNINKLNGITVADATAIQQHVTGINPITSPYKQVAADVNKSNSISTFDATIINQALLGNPAAMFQFKTSWRFVPASYTMPVPPWGFPENIGLTGVSSSVPEQNFWGIKTGDIIDTYANPASFAAPPPLVFQLDDRTLRAGDDLVLNFRSSQFDDLTAWQFALRFDPTILEWTGIEPGREQSLALTTDHFGLYNISEGEIRSVWSQATGVSLPEAEAVFQLKFKVLQSSGLLSEAVRLDQSTLPAYAYNSALEQSGIALHFNQATHTNQLEGQPALHLLAQPNPFAGQTLLRFRLPEASAVQIRVLDAAGRELWLLDKRYPAGYQQETIQLAGQPGMLFCEVTTAWGTQMLKLILLDM